MDLIHDSLKMIPFALNKELWNPLRKFNLLRTPQEQRYFLLENAKPSSMKKTSYSEGVERALRSVLALDPQTNSLELHFKDGHKAELDLLLRDQYLMINDKWLDFAASHSETPCSLYTDASDQDITINHFECSHILLDLFDKILDEINKYSDGGGNRTHICGSLRLKAIEKIDNMPSEVSVSRGEKPREIDVSWMHPVSERAFKRYKMIHMGLVILHCESTCSIQKQQFLRTGMFCLTKELGRSLIESRYCERVF